MRACAQNWHPEVVMSATGASRDIPPWLDVNDSACSSPVPATARSAKALCSSPDLRLSDFMAARRCCCCGRAGENWDETPVGVRAV